MVLGHGLAGALGAAVQRSLFQAAREARRTRSCLLAACPRNVRRAISPTRLSAVRSALGPRQYVRPSRFYRERCQLALSAPERACHDLAGFVRGKLCRHGKEATFISVHVALQQSYDVLCRGHFLELIVGQFVGAMGTFASIHFNVSDISRTSFQKYICPQILTQVAKTIVIHRSRRLIVPCTSPSCAVACKLKLSPCVRS